MNLKKKIATKELNKVVTLGVLLEYTDSFLLPRMSDIIEKKLENAISGLKKEMAEMRVEFKKDLAAMKYDLKDYVDHKLANQTSDIFKRLNKRYEATEESDQKFKLKQSTSLNKVILAHQKTGHIWPDWWAPK